MIAAEADYVQVAGADISLQGIRRKRKFRTALRRINMFGTGEWVSARQVAKTACCSTRELLLLSRLLKAAGVLEKRNYFCNGSRCFDWRLVPAKIEVG